MEIEKATEGPGLQEGEIRILIWDKGRLICLLDMSTSGVFEQLLNKQLRI